MRRKSVVGAFLVLLLLLLILPVAGEEGTEEGVLEDFSELESILPEDIAALLPNGFFDASPSGNTEGVRQASRFSYLIGVIGNRIGLHLSDALALFAALLGLIILSALSARFRTLFKSDMLRSAFTLCSSCAILACVISLQYGEMQSVMEFFDRMSALVNGMIPLTGALYAMGGNVSTAVVGNAGMMMFLNLCENFCTVSLRAAVGVCTALAVCSAFTPNMNFSGITNFVKKIYTFFLGFLMLLLSFSLSVQTVLTSAADSVAMRGAKMLAGSAIPIVGGSVGDTLKTVSGSVTFLKSTVGVGGIVLLVLLLVPTLLSVLLYRLAFMAAGACAELLGCERENKLLGNFVTIYGYMLASVCICSVTFIFLLTLFVRCSVAVGV